MKTRNYISIHPVDFKLLDNLNINKDPEVNNSRVGSIISRLAKQGYNDVQVSVYLDAYKLDLIHIAYHCKKKLT